MVRGKRAKDLWRLVGLPGTHANASSRGSFLLSSIININLHILPTDTNPTVFGAAKMSTVHIKSAAEFQKLLSSSRIVVADCEYYLTAEVTAPLPLHPG